MQIRDAARHPDRPISQFNSAGFEVGPLGPGLHVVVVRLEPGGMIGRHPAVECQALFPLVGSARVSGEDGTIHPVRPGQAAVWNSGEHHETSTTEGLVALILEGPDLADAFDG